MHYSKKNLINKYQNKYILDFSTVLHPDQHSTDLDRHGRDCIAGKTTDMPQVTDKCYPIMMYRVHFASAGFEHVSVMGTDSIGSCNSNYDTITTMTVQVSRVLVRMQNGTKI
jgi:hypothetical protein